MLINEFKDFTRFLLYESGSIIRSYFRTSIQTSTKNDNSPVTIADKQAEEKIRSLIQRYYPDHGIIGEEYGVSNPEANYKWILDPIDGTKSFISGAVTFGTLIGLQFKGEMILGAFHQPILNEMLIGDNQTTELNGVQVSLRKCEDLSSATLLTTDHLNIEKYQNLNKFMNLVRKVRLYRQWGDCYGYYLVATGFADIMIDPIMNPWDTAALIPIIKGAGGIITDYKGNDALTGNSTIACSAELIKEVIDTLNG